MRHTLRLLGSLTVGLALAAASPAHADGTVVGSITDVSPNDGTASYAIIRGATSIERPAVGAQLRAGDSVGTGDGTMLTLTFQDNSSLVVGPKSHFKADTLSDSTGSSSSALSDAYGFFRAVVNKVYSGSGQSFQVTTGNCVMGVRGTQFVIQATKDASGKLTTTLDTLEGTVAIWQGATAEKDRLRVESGYETNVQGSGKPATPVKVTRDGLRDRLERVLGALGRTFLDKDVVVKAGGADSVDFGLKPAKPAKPPGTSGGATH